MKDNAGLAALAIGLGIILVLGTGFLFLGPMTPATSESGVTISR